MIARLAAWILLSQIADFSMPDSKMKEFFRVIVGLVMLSMLISPLADLLNGNKIQSLLSSTIAVKQEVETISIAGFSSYQEDAIARYGEAIEKVAQKEAENYGLQSPIAYASLDENGNIIKLTIAEYGAYPASSIGGGNSDLRQRIADMLEIDVSLVDTP